MLRERTGVDGESVGEPELPDAVGARLPTTLRADGGYRSLLAALVEQGGTCSLSALTRTLVDRAGWPATEEATNPYQQTHIALVREYIPVLVEFGVVDYDDELGTVGLVAGEPSDSR
jgi:hypothetical protein